MKIKMCFKKSKALRKHGTFLFFMKCLLCFLRSAQHTGHIHLEQTHHMHIPSDTSPVLGLGKIGPE